MINQEDILYGKITVSGKPILIDENKLLIDIFNKSVMTIKLTSDMTSIPKNAFMNCTALTDIYVPWSEGEVAHAPWGATNATINYNYNPT